MSAAYCREAQVDRRFEALGGKLATVAPAFWAEIKAEEEDDATTILLPGWGPVATRLNYKATRRTSEPHPAVLIEPLPVAGRRRRLAR